MAVLPKAPRFLADAMLGSVARKLRIFGFDTLYMVHAHDDDVLKTGIEQSRVILTADRELFKRTVKVGAPAVLVNGGSDIDDIVHILTKSGIASVSFDSSRCTACNGLLASRAPDQVRGGLPGRIADSHNRFFQCADCRKVYWEGGHFRRIRALAESVDSRLARAAVS